uniref:Ig-like domain-containing protein n=1 Tax=Anser brachyrhynchus TaxID=132585 RepID=A0A8B9BI81_9AVES
AILVRQAVWRCLPKICVPEETLCDGGIDHLKQTKDSSKVFHFKKLFFFLSIDNYAIIFLFFFLFFFLLNILWTFVGFLCTVSGTPVIEVAWQKDGTTISPSDHHKISKVENKHVLEISLLTTSDRGVYTCKASNKFGADICLFFLLLTIALSLPSLPNH